MKRYPSAPGVRLLPLLILLTAAALPLAATGTAVIPGDINRICYYTDFFFNHPESDFFYYLNDRLLFMEKPDGILVSSGFRRKLLTVLRQHRATRSFLHRYTDPETGLVTLATGNSKNFKQAAKVLLQLGFKLIKEKNGRFSVTVLPSAAAAVEYSRFALLDATFFQRELNRNNSVTFGLKETTLSLPWDFGFLRSITGLQLNKDSFFRHFLENESFSLLLGTLYRMSGREINYINRLSRDAWKEIYENKHFLMSMYILSHALRVTEDKRWSLPGGPGAEPFWTELAGCSPYTEPLDFLRRMVIRDEGKSLYLFLFSSFLPPATQQYLLTGPNAVRTAELYFQYRLPASARLRPNRFPRFKSSSLFTVLYALRIKDGKLDISPDIRDWLRATLGFSFSRPGNPPDIFALLEYIVNQPEVSRSTSQPLEAFVSIYNRFSHRPGLLTPKVLEALFRRYDDFNILIDFIEKLNIQEAATALELFQWVDRVALLPKEDRQLCSALFQSLLEVLCHIEKYAPQRYNQDRLALELMKIDLDRAGVYDGVFNFCRTHLGMRDHVSLLDTLLTGIDNQVLRIDDTEYYFNINASYRENIEAILRSQECARWPLFTIINQVLENIVTEEIPPDAVGFGNQVVELFQQLPYAEISRSAPKEVRERVMAYSREAFLEALGELVQQINTYASKAQLKLCVKKMKEDYLVYQLKDYLVALTYAVNTKNPELRIFFNPNLTRLHDFSYGKTRTPWNYSGTPDLREDFSEYHFCGGLSRLNLTMASKWQEHLFRRTYIYNAPQVQSLVVNLLDAYPYLKAGDYLRYNALLIEFGLELLKQAPRRPALATEIRSALGVITTGYHYRQAVEYLSGNQPRHPLFYSEIRRLGEQFLENKKHLELTPHRAELEQFTRRRAKKAKTRPMEQDYCFGGIYYRTFGNLTPRQVPLFPQEIANFFHPGWVSGEMLDEFKVKLAWHLYRKEIPVSLLGEILYLYFNKTAPRFLSQNHPKDYISTYFIFEIFNDAHLRRIVKNLQKEGHLKLK